MGNCIDVMSYRPKEKVRVVSYHGDVLEFKGLTPVKKVTCGAYVSHNLVDQSQPFSPLPPKTKLEASGVYYLVPDHELATLKVLIPPKLKVADCIEKDHESCKRQKIKIVVTRQQLLKFLLTTGTTKLAEQGSPSSSPRWRPSLASIAEANDF